jgi:hypothetical protein
MKKSAYVLGLIVFTILACEKNESDYDMLRSNIVGEWVINHTGQEIRADTVYREFDYFLEATFNADGTGSREVTTFIVDTTIQFDWYYQLSPQQVIIIPKPAGPIPSSIVISVPPQVHDVYTNEPDRQVWERESDDPSNIADVFLHTWEMERK